MTNIPISILIPTKNEERNIAACLASVSWSDDITVFDSYSTDATAAIVSQYSARFVQRQFDNFADHKNWALSNLPFRYNWILIVDADERVSQELADEINTVIQNSTLCDGYYIPRKNYFCDKWIRHGGWYPDYQMRLLRKGKARYENRIVHEHVLISTAPAYLKNPLIHYDYKGIERYFDRHNVYSSLEAVECFKTLTQSSNQSSLKSSLLKKGPEKRRFLKNLAYKYLPCRSLIKFFWMYIIKLGFLDGRIGFRYCLLHTFYEYQVSLKLEELKQPDSPMREKYRQYLKENPNESR